MEKMLAGVVLAETGRQGVCRKQHDHKERSEDIGTKAWVNDKVG